MPWGLTLPIPPSHEPLQGEHGACRLSDSNKSLVLGNISREVGSDAGKRGRFEGALERGTGLTLPLAVTRTAHAGCNSREHSGEFHSFSGFQPTKPRFWARYD
jgi:hypothetical protein